MKLFVFGNGNLSFASFLTLYRAPILKLDFTQTTILLCDFRGVDTLLMELLKDITPQVQVFHIGSAPRYLPERYRTKVSAWQLHGGFESDDSRDAAAIAACSHFLAVDQNSNESRKSGTLRNIETCTRLEKIPLVPSSDADNCQHK